jgi:TRAP-type C4-dicarboxylate transport system permease small subunit
VKLLGHCFYTHLEGEQTIAVTLFLWLVLLGSAYAVSHLS